MRKIRLLIFLISMFFLSLICSGCWNYREIDRLSIVTGMAIDKGISKKYMITFEFADVSLSGKETKIGTKVVEIEGETIFDAVRNVIKVSGKRLFFSHIKVVVISEAIANDGIVQILDFLNRDSESRLNLNILISKEATAREILTQQSISSPNRSFELYLTLKAQVNLSKAPDITLKEVINAISGEGISAVLPAVRITRAGDYMTSDVSGAAIFKKDKLIGYLNEEETKIFLLITNRLKRGILLEKRDEKSLQSDISLEILRVNKTKVKSISEGDQLVMNIETSLRVGLSEQSGPEDYISEAGYKQLRIISEETLNKQIISLIKKVQQQYEVDIFGFGRIVKAKEPKLWKSIGGNWSEKYKNLNITASSKINIRNTGLSMKTIKVGD